MWTIHRANGCEQRLILPLYPAMWLYTYTIARLYEAGIALALKPTRKTHNPDAHVHKMSLDMGYVRDR